MVLFKNRNARVLILIMSALVFLGIVISYFYYKSINESVDPRISDARELYEKYNQFVQNNSIDSVFRLMDTIESIYNNLDHYRNSFETGVLYNNRAAAYLSMALKVDSTDSSAFDSLLVEAEREVVRAIGIYKNWINLYSDLNKEEVEQLISTDFFIGLEAYSEKQKRKFLGNRVKEILNAQVETKRRYSVSLTNQGIIYHNRKQYETAAEYYHKAVDLWDQNLTAENNLNILLGQPIRKRNLLQKLFPPQKIEN
jgi:tetratricopeptide (TPR) repeat protein